MSDSAVNRSTRSRRSLHHVPSPLDPFLQRFLTWVGERPEGLNPTLGLQTIAGEFDWQLAFTEVLFTAARSRGLIQPRQLSGSRGKILWSVSPRGIEWLTIHQAQHDPAGSRPSASDD